MLKCLPMLDTLSSKEAPFFIFFAKSFEIDILVWDLGKLFWLLCAISPLGLNRNMECVTFLQNFLELHLSFTATYCQRHKSFMSIKFGFKTSDIVWNCKIFFSYPNLLNYGYPISGNCKNKFCKSTSSIWKMLLRI